MRLLSTAWQSDARISYLLVMCVKENAPERVLALEGRRSADRVEHLEHVHYSYYSHASTAVHCTT